MIKRGVKKHPLSPNLPQILYITDPFSIFTEEVLFTFTPFKYPLLETYKGYII
jgi:hypothetical protein